MRSVSPNSYKEVRTLADSNNKKAYSFVQRGIKEGYFVPFFDYNVVLNFIALSSKLTLGNPIFQKYDVNHLFTNTAVLFLRGFCTQKGVDFIDNKLLKTTSQNK